MFKHIHSIMSTTIPPSIIRLLLSFIPPFQFKPHSNHKHIQTFLSHLPHIYQINISLCLPLIIIILSFLFKIPTLPPILISTFSPIILATFNHHFKI
ncbi:Na+/H+ antiporter NhaC family protein, partial [Staphylococcus aureus]|uniref:Na+/H+ antiporter NhaC family protein n=1 Tax=Staphylococcus aureus TaxID=1280 RepID=UPI0037DA4100